VHRSSIFPLVRAGYTVSHCARPFVAFLHFNATKQGSEELLTAAVERGPSEGARSGSKESSSRPCASPSRPRLARAQETIQPALACSYQSPSLISQAGRLVDPRLRALHMTFLILHISLGGVAEAALYCAHRTSTFLSCAFCEQEGHLAAPPNLLQARSLSLRDGG
jgi:hypothetical protein